MLEKMVFLKAAENRDTFFKRIALLFPRSDPRFQKIEKAYDTFEDAFRHVARDGGEKYFEHLRAVALIVIDWLRVTDYELIIASLGHDVVEDIDSWTIDRVRLEFGDRVAFLIDWMTKPPVEEHGSKEARDKMYHDRFKFAPREFFLLKLPDRFHNLTTLWSCTPEKRARKIAETKLYYVRYAEEQLILYHEIQEAIDNLEKEAP